MANNGTRRRILIVENEMMIAMNLEDMLADLGHDVIGLATRVAPAMELARNGNVDLAVLDINVAGEQSFVVADILRARGIPFIFTTGYGREGLADRYHEELVLEKPFDPLALERAIASIATS